MGVKILLNYPTKSEVCPAKFNTSKGVCNWNQYLASVIGFILGMSMLYTAMIFKTLTAAFLLRFFSLQFLQKRGYYKQFRISPIVYRRSVKALSVPYCCFELQCFIVSLLLFQPDASRGG